MPIRVIIGLGPESANQEHLIPQVEAFFRGGMNDAEQETLLLQQNVDWILHGPLEKDLGLFDPATIDSVSLAYSEAGYQIYRVGGDS